MSDQRYSSAPTGCRSGWASPACRSSTPRGTCRRRGAMRAPNTRQATFPARCSSTTTTSSIRTRTCRTPCRGRRCSRAWSARWASPPTDTIVVYDGPGLFSAPRVRWMFRTMGAKEVFLLEGGADAWKAEGRPLTSRADQGRAQRLRRVVRRKPGRRPRGNAARSSRPASARSPTRGRPAALPAPTRSRGPACAAATCRARPACRPSRCRRDGKLLPPRGAARDLRQGRRRPRKAGRHVVRFGRHRGGHFAGAGNAWPQGQQAVRRVMERMGRTQ